MSPSGYRPSVPLRRILRRRERYREPERPPGGTDLRRVRYRLPGMGGRRARPAMADVLRSPAMASGNQYGPVQLRNLEQPAVRVVLARGTTRTRARTRASRA